MADKQFVYKEMGRTGFFLKVPVPSRPEKQQKVRVNRLTSIPKVVRRN